MSFVEKWVKKLFPGQTKVPLLHETLQRSTKEQGQAKQWQGTMSARQLVQSIYQSYHYKKTGIKGTPEVHLFNSAYANGFAVTYAPEVGPKVFAWLLDYLKDEVLALGYRQANADRKVEDKGPYMQETQRYYLKPPVPINPETKIDQLYGNITLEYISIDDKPSYIKVMANIYSDRLFNNALPFEEFVERLLGPDAL